MPTRACTTNSTQTALKQPPNQHSYSTQTPLKRHSYSHPTSIQTALERQATSSNTAALHGVFDTAEYDAVSSWVTDTAHTHSRHSTMKATASAAPVSPTPPSTPPSIGALGMSDSWSVVQQRVVGEWIVGCCTQVTDTATSTDSDRCCNVP